MKFKTLAAASLLMCVFASRDAEAADCTLGITPASYIPVGQTFSFVLYITDFGPLPPYGYSVVFYGSKDGVADIPSTGWAYPGTYGQGQSTLSGFGNPGGISGNYTRFVVLYDPNGQVACVSNTISATLQ